MISDEKMTVIKPKLEKLVESRKPNIVQLLRKLSEFEDCVCSRPPTLIICSGGGCSYSFTGRLKTTCPCHPGDQYLMDHSPLCPKCKNVLGYSLQIHFIYLILNIIISVEKSDEKIKLQAQKSPDKIETSTIVCETAIHCTPVLAKKSRTKRLS